MTLCIAAECEHEGNPAIVLCCDWRGARGTEFKELVSSEDVYKIREFEGFEASALVSGHETDADRLLASCDPAVRKFCGLPTGQDSDIFITDFLRDLEKAAGFRKAEIIEHFVKMTLGLDYAALRAIPRDRLSDLDEEAYRTIRGLNLNTDVIIAMFSDEPVIVKLDRYGRAAWESNYSVVGEGADIALAFLCQQPWDLGGSSDPPTEGPVLSLTLMQCLYRVYEAKKAAERNRGVGRSTAFSVLIRGQGKHDVSDGCREILLEAFKRKSRVPQLKFEASFLMPDEEEKPTEKPKGTFVGRHRTFDHAMPSIPPKTDPAS